jgi:hypothetical protein
MHEFGRDSRRLLGLTLVLLLVMFLAAGHGDAVSLMNGTLH